MILRRSRFVHQVPVGKDRTLIVHAISQHRFPADRDIGALLDYFGEPRRIPGDCDAMTALFANKAGTAATLREAVERAVTELRSRQILTEQTPEEELAAVGAELAPSHGRDPADMLDRYRRGLKEGAQSYWAAGASYGLEDFSTDRQRVDVILFGDCDVQMEADFLRREAARRNVDLHVSATFPDDIRFAAERRHGTMRSSSVPCGPGIWSPRISPTASIPMPPISPMSPSF